MRLTVKERVLLHLLESREAAGEPEVSSDVTQEGIASSAGIQRRHLVQFIRPLMEQGLVRERQAHVAGIRQRRKVYELTPAGRTTATRLREQVKSQVVRIRDGEAFREESLDQALRGTGGKASLLEAIRQVQQAGVLDLEMARHPPESGFVEQLWDAPRIAVFVGRQEELSEVLREDGGPQIYVIRGVAGIGKTALAAKVCELLRGRRNLFWHRVRPWETEQAILAPLGKFLESLDRPGLASVLKRGQIGLAPEVLRQDLPDTHAVLVFDDAHEASPETLGLFRMLCESVGPAHDVRILILTRRALPFYDLRDVELRHLVREIELRGLKSHDAAALLSECEDSSNLAGLGRRLAGHPLFIDLVRSHRYDVPEAVKDVERFVEETVYRTLSRAEKATMKAASLYEVPVPRETLLSIPGSSYEALASLRERSLIRSVGGNRYEVHDTIRDFFRNVLTPRETHKYGSLAATRLRELASTSAAEADFASATAYLSNALRLSSRQRDRAEILEALGDASDRMGDLLAALVWYRDALRAAKNALPSARLRRKLASTLCSLGESASAEAEIQEATRSLGAQEYGERGSLDLVRSRMSIAAEDWSGGREHAEAAIREFRRCHDVRGQVEGLIALAVTHINSRAGSPASANECLQEALSLSESMADWSLAASAHIQFANLYAYRLGDADRAMDHLGAIEALPQTLVDLRARQSVLMLEGWLNLDLRANFAAAQESFDAAVALSQKFHDPVNTGLAKHGAAMTAYQRGDWDAGLAGLDEVASELLELGCPGPSVEALYSAVEISLAQGKLEGAAKRMDRLKDPRLARGLKGRPVLALALRGIRCVGEGDRNGAHEAFQDAIRLAEQEGSPLERSLISSSHDTYGAALRAMGEDRDAQAQEQLAVDSARRFGLKGRLAARVDVIPRLGDALRRMFASVHATS